MLAASWGFAAKGETSCFPVTYSCPPWELFFQAEVWGRSTEHREAGTEQGKDLGRMEVRQRIWFLRICCRDWDLISYALVSDAGEQEADPLRAYQKPGSTVG